MSYVLKYALTGRKLYCRSENCKSMYNADSVVQEKYDAFPTQYTHCLFLFLSYQIKLYT